MKTFLYVLGFIWLLPMTILVWLFYVLPLLAFGNIKFAGWHGPVAKFKVVEKTGWYYKKWQGWAGWSGPCVYIYKELTKDHYPRFSEALLNQLNNETATHELRHCDQQFVFGVFHYPAYLLCFIALWIYGTITNKDIHGYYDNPFEVDARKAAGQMVKIPRDRWAQGPNDRNPWF